MPPTSTEEKSRPVSRTVHRFDVIIVGARCAGASLAALLARAGLQVGVLDRSRFPSDTPSTHGIQPAGVRVLDELGVGARLRQMTPPIDDGIVALGRSRIEYRGITALLGSPMLNIRRTSLDTVLVEAAAEAGATVLTGTTVKDLVWEEGRVVGVQTANGALCAPLVVGADGMSSTVARLAGAEEYERTEPGRLFTWAYFEGVAGTAVSDTGTLMMGKIGDNAFLASPTDDGLYITAVVPSLCRKDEFMADLHGAYISAVRTWPELEAVMGTARRVGPIRVMSRWHGYFRRSAGPGWVLVGDAGHFKDPTPGQGIADALRQVARLAPTIEHALGRADADRLLYDWWRWRDQDAFEMYWFANDMGSPGATTSLMAEIQARIAVRRRLTEDLIRVLNHDLPPSRLAKPSLVLPAFLAAITSERSQRLSVLREAADRVRTDRRRRHRMARRQARHAVARTGSDARGGAAAPARLSP
jgi:2-polyprenyl-6-methoxyphenol hydroxylase-like FAD-dependent oxidoreductase